MDQLKIPHPLTAKEKGNLYFQKGDYENALELYTQAIATYQPTEDNQDLHILLSNRSATYILLKDYENALKDANVVLSLKKKWAKGYYRRGCALYYLKRYAEALDDFNEGLELDPNSKEFKQRKEATIVMVQKVYQNEEMPIENVRLDPITEPLIKYLKMVNELYLPQRQFKHVQNDPRLQAFRRAIWRNLSDIHSSGQPSPTAHVLDIDSGLGLLAMITAVGGQVVGPDWLDISVVERGKWLSKLSKTLWNGNQKAFARDMKKNHVRFLRCSATDLQIALKGSNAIPRKADLVVLESFDYGFLGLKLIPTINHLHRKQLLNPAAKFVPAAVKMFAISAQIRFENISGFNVENFDKFRNPLGYFAGDVTELTENEYKPLSEPVEFLSLSFNSPIPESSLNITISFPTTTSGVCTAIVFWYRAQLSDDESISNAPDYTFLARLEENNEPDDTSVHCNAGGGEWTQAIQYLPAPQMVKKGDTLTIDVRYTSNGLVFAPHNFKLKKEASWLQKCKSVPRWHFPMLADEKRNAAFNEAITKALKGEKRPSILDVGTGSGLLAMMAARCNPTAIVTACEMVPHIAESAMKIILVNKLEERIKVIPKHSTRLEVGSDLKERVSLLLAEIVEQSLLSGGIIPTLQHAHEHLLATNAKVIPAGATLYVCALDLHIGEVDKLDLGLLNRLRYNHYESGKLNKIPHTRQQICKKTQNHIVWHRLSDPIPVFHFDFTQPKFEKEEKEIGLTIRRAGMLNAVAVWFTLHLDNEIEISSAPGDCKAWDQTIYFLDDEMDVMPGIQCFVNASHDKTRIHFELQKNAFNFGEMGVNLTALGQNQLPREGKFLQKMSQEERKQDEVGKSVFKKINDRRNDPVLWNVLSTFVNNSNDLDLDREMTQDFVTQLLY